MSGDNDLPLMPDSFKVEWNEDRFWYWEVCQVPDGVDSQKVASQTEYSLMTLVEEAGIPDEVDINTEIRRRPASGEVVAEVEMMPGKPENMPHAGMVMICSEMMAQILGKNQETFEGIVKGAVATAGSGDMKSMVMNEMFSETRIPDRD